MAVTGAVVEWLRFEGVVDRDRFIAVDEQVWTAALAQCPGFLSKAAWCPPQEPGTVIFVIHWQSRELWKGIDPAWLGAIEAEFQAQVAMAYQLVEVKEFQVQASTELAPGV